MLQKLKVRAESFDKWAHKVKNALEAAEGSKLGTYDYFLCVPVFYFLLLIAFVIFIL